VGLFQAELCISDTDPCGATPADAVLAGQNCHSGLSRGTLSGDRVVAHIGGQ